MRWPKWKPPAEPKVKIEPDPDMAPGEWQWSCSDCDAGGTGPDQEIRAESMTHCLVTGHSVMGNALS